MQRACLPGSAPAPPRYARSARLQSARPSLPVARRLQARRGRFPRRVRGLLRCAPRFPLFVVPGAAAAVPAADAQPTGCKPLTLRTTPFCPAGNSSRACAACGLWAGGRGVCGAMEGGRCRAFRPNLLGLLFLGPCVAAVQGRGCGRSMGLPARLFWLARAQRVEAG